MADQEAEAVTVPAVHPRRAELARLVRVVALSAAEERRTRFGDGLDELIGDAGLKPETDGTVDDFDVLKALRRAEPPVAKGRSIIGHLLAEGVLATDLDTADDAKRAATALSWLASETWLDGLSALPGLRDEASDEALARLRAGLRDVVASTDQAGAPRGRGAALAAALILTQLQDTAALATVEDPLVRALVSRPSAATEASVEEAPVDVPAGSTGAVKGELVPTPMHPVWLFLSCVTGFILLRWLWRFVYRMLLRARRPAAFSLEASGVKVTSDLQLLGKPMRKAEVVIPFDNLARAEREVRYPRLAVYAGLFMLAVGTFAGASIFTDGARSGSPSLMAIGAVVFGVGVVLDVLLNVFVPARQGKHRLLLVPRKGRALAIAVEDEKAADRLLQQLGRTVQPPTDLASSPAE